MCRSVNTRRLPRATKSCNGIHRTGGEGSKEATDADPLLLLLLLPPPRPPLPPASFKLARRNRLFMVGVVIDRNVSQSVRPEPPQIQTNVHFQPPNAQELSRGGVGQAIW